MLNVLLVLSIILNLLFLIVCSKLIAKRGGIRYLTKRLLKTKTDLPSYYSAYYLHRSNLIEQFPIDFRDVVFLGDSLTDQAEWSELFKEVKTRNRGISGDTTRGLLTRLNPILQAQPKTIFLMIGINDFINEQRSVTEVCETYQQILKKIQVESPKTNVIIQSILPVNSKLCGHNLECKITEMNQQLKDLANQFSYQYVDLFSNFVNSVHQLDSQYTLDGVHLNGKGYKLWHQILESYLKIHKGKVTALD